MHWVLGGWGHNFQNSKFKFALFLAWLDNERGPCFYHFFLTWEPSLLLCDFSKSCCLIGEGVKMVRGRYDPIYVCMRRYISPVLALVLDFPFWVELFEYNCVCFSSCCRVFKKFKIFFLKYSFLYIFLNRFNMLMSKIFF